MRPPGLWCGCPIHSRQVQTSHPATKRDQKNSAHFGRAPLLYPSSQQHDARCPQHNILQTSHHHRWNKKDVSRLLNYVSNHSNTIIQHHTSGMCLHIYSGSSYLSIIKYRSFAGVYFYLNDTPRLPTSTVSPKPNGILHSEYKTLRNIIAFTVEAKLGALFHNGQLAEPILTFLDEIGYLQLSTSLKTNNSTVAGIFNSSIRPTEVQSYGYTILLKKRQGVTKNSGLLGIGHDK